MPIKDLLKVNKHLFFCNGESCKKKGAVENTIAVRAELERRGLNETVHTTKTLCNGRCNDGPIVIMMPDGWWFKNMVGKNARKFVDDILMNDRLPASQILFRYGSDIINSED